MARGTRPQWHFDWLPAVNALPNLSNPARAVAVAFVKHADNRTGITRPTDKRLVAECAMSRSSVKRGRLELCERGVVRLLTEGHRHTGIASEYQLIPPSEWMALRTTENVTGVQTWTPLDEQQGSKTEQEGVQDQPLKGFNPEPPTAVKTTAADTTTTSLSAFNRDATDPDEPDTNPTEPLSDHERQERELSDQFEAWRGQHPGMPILDAWRQFKANATTSSTASAVRTRP